MSNKLVRGEVSVSDLIGQPLVGLTRELVARHVSRIDWRSRIRSLLTVDGSPKMRKSLGRGYLPAALYLAPVRLAGRQACGDHSAGCADACLFSAGRGLTDSVRIARVERTWLYFLDRPKFLGLLREAISRLQRRAESAGLRLAVRLNGTSDRPWESSGLMSDFPNVQYWDYTKSLRRAIASTGPNWPTNYQLTYSRSETNHDQCLTALASGVSVSVVFRPKPAVGSRYRLDGDLIPRVVVDGDAHDLRFLDPRPSIVALSAKGAAKDDDSGFVVGGGAQCG